MATSDKNLNNPFSRKDYFHKNIDTLALELDVNLHNKDGNRNARLQASGPFRRRRKVSFDHASCLKIIHSKSLRLLIS